MVIPLYAHGHLTYPYIFMRHSTEIELEQKRKALAHAATEHKTKRVAEGVLFLPSEAIGL